MHSGADTPSLRYKTSSVVQDSDTGSDSDSDSDGLEMASLVTAPSEDLSDPDKGSEVDSTYSGRAQSSWNRAEEKRLRKILGYNPPKTWDQVSEYIGRSVSSCKKKAVKRGWNKKPCSGRPPSNRRECERSDSLPKWTTEADKLLLEKRDEEGRGFKWISRYGVFKKLGNYEECQKRYEWLKKEQEKEKRREEQKKQRAPGDGIRTEERKPISSASDATGGPPSLRSTPSHTPSVTTSYLSAPRHSPPQQSPDLFRAQASAGRAPAASQIDLKKRRLELSREERSLEDSRRRATKENDEGLEEEYLDRLHQLSQEQRRVEDDIAKAKSIHSASLI